MRVLTTTEARAHLARLVSSVRYSNRIIAIGRRKKAEALLIKFPDQINSKLSELTNVNQYGGGFSWLEDEPDIYTRKDLKKSYV